jgi:transposase
LNADETGIKVDGKRYWLWTFVTSKETLLVINKSRGKKVLDQVLGKDFEDYLGCNGWKSYSNFTDKLECCWAHLLREAEWLAQHFNEAKRLYSAVQHLFVYLTDALVGEPPVCVRKNLVVRGKHRLRYWLNKPYKGKETKRFIKKVRNGFDHWFTLVMCLVWNRLDNRAERALREPVVQRKIIGTFRNDKVTRSMRQ